MEIINDLERIRFYYEKFNMNRLFSDSLLEELELIKFNRAEYLCYEEEKLTHLMFLVEGKAKVFRTLANGKSMLIAFYEPFEVMGEVELLEERTASCTVQALANCFVLAMNMSTARARLEEDPIFLKFACRMLAEKLHQLGSSSSVNLYYPLENRLASYILITAVTLKGANGKEEKLFNENLTHLSELMGTSYRHLLRTINGLCQKNVITKVEKGYLILSEERLEALAGDLL